MEKLRFWSEREKTNLLVLVVGDKLPRVAQRTAHLMVHYALILARALDKIL